MLERENTLETLIKKINLMGGKTAPLISESIYKVNQRVNKIENAIECDIFKQATHELYFAATELSFIRKKYIKTFLAGFTAALCFVGILTAILASSGVLLVAHHG